VDDLWDDDPPASARNALQVYVSHLRGRLGKQTVTSMGGGYRLELSPERVDALVFERLVAHQVEPLDDETGDASRLFARVRQLPPHALAAAMDDGLALVTGGGTRPPRQRTCMP
jgi:DNA-binding SARP family transcriptional activator